MSSVLTWLVRKGSACGDLYTLLFTAKIAAQKGRAVSFLTLFCIPCLDSLWLCMPCLVRAPCGFADTKRYLLPIQKKKVQSVEKNTSQWESEILAASNAFQVSMVLQFFFYTPLIEAAISSFCGFLRDRAHLALHPSNCQESSCFSCTYPVSTTVVLNINLTSSERAGTVSFYQPVKSYQHSAQHTDDAVNFEYVNERPQSLPSRSLYVAVDINSTYICQNKKDFVSRFCKKKKTNKKKKR